LDACYACDEYVGNDTAYGDVASLRARLTAMETQTADVLRTRSGRSITRGHTHSSIGDDVKRRDQLQTGTIRYLIDGFLIVRMFSYPASYEYKNSK